MSGRFSKGGTLVEFTIVATVFYMVLFAIIEFGRVLYTWNVLDEVTRRGARLAAVCRIDDTDAIIARATFNGRIIKDLSAQNLLIEYLDGAGAPIDNPDADFVDIRYVRAKISEYQLQTFIPLLPFLFDAPAFETVLPSESLGIVPEDAIVGGGEVNC